MGDGGFFRGTSSEQDARFSDKMKKLIRNSKFPKNFFKKVNLKKVQLSVFRPWITRRITELLGVEDDIVIEFALSILDQESCDPKASQIHLTGFLEKNSPIFMQELWDLLLDAQENPTGIPTKFIEEKKEELRRKKIEEEKIRKRLERERLQESAAREEARLIRQKEREKNPDSSAIALAPPRESSKRSSDRRSPSPHNRHSDRHRNSHRSRSRERSSRREHRDSSDRGRDHYRSEHRRRDTHSRRSEADDRDEHSLRSGRDREKDYNSIRGGNSYDREHKHQTSKKPADSANLDDPSLIYDDIQDTPLDYDRSSKRHHR